MEIFISWSGPRGESLAKAIREWLPKVIQSLKPWISASDIEKGARWLNDISEKLENTNFGILCLTPENINEPWVLFEAGALSKALSSSSVCPILFELSPSDLRGPLSQFQVTKLNQEDMFKLLKTINNSLQENSLQAAQLEESFNLWWPQLEEKIKAIGPILETTAKKISDRELLDEILKVVRRLESQSCPSIEDLLFVKQTRQALATLTPREELSMRMKFGIDQSQKDIKEISNKLEISEKEAKQLINSSLRKLRYNGLMK